MISIVVAGPAADRRISGLLPRVLDPHGPLLCVTPRGLTVPREPPRFLIWDVKYPYQMEGSPILLVIKESFQDFTGLPLPRCRAVVVGSDNAPALDFLAGSGLQAITCGLSSRDTFTLTSMSVTGAVVALQRNLTAWDGTSMEPAEFPVHLPAPTDSHSLLCCAATLAFAGLLRHDHELHF